MGVNRVTMNTPDGEQTVMDITDTSATPETVADGVVFYGADGERKTGTAVGGIPVPETAGVGQTVVVTAVDENGKPTEWEAKDLPKGGGVTGDVVRPKDLQEYTPKHYMKMAGILSTADGSVLPNCGSGMWSSVAYGENTMVMIAAGTNLAARKVDGKQWESIELPKSANWTDIAYGDGFFVAIASGDSQFAVSENGVDWELVDTWMTYNWTSIVWSGSEFIVTQDGADGFGAMVCDNGDAYSGWQFAYAVPPASKVLCVNGKYYLLGVALCVSNDIWADTWEQVTNDWGFTDIAYGDGMFVGANNSSNVHYSTDFITWSDPCAVFTANGYSYTFNKISYCNGRFAVFFDYSNLGASATAEEIRNWEFYGELNMGYPSVVHLVKSLGHQVVVVRDSADEVPSYWHFDGGDSVTPMIDIITPPSGGGGGGSYSDWSEEDKAAVLNDVIAKLPVYNGEVEDV